LDKFRDKNGDWREDKQAEEDTPKVVVHYTVQEDEAERGNLRA